MEAVGLIQAIISVIQESPSPMFDKNKVVVNPKQLLDMLEKLKGLLERKELSGRSSHEAETKLPWKKKSLAETNPEVFGLEGEALLRQAKDEAEKMRESADKYAENVLTNLQVVITKMMRTIENGKERLNKYQDKAE